MRPLKILEFIKILYLVVLILTEHRPMSYNALFALLFLIFLPLSVVSQSLSKSDYKITVSKDSTNQELHREIDSLAAHASEEYYKRNYNKAILYGELGIELNNKLKDREIYFHLNSIVGNTYIRLNDTLMAREIFEASREAAALHEDSTALCGVNIDLGNIYSQQEQYDKAITIFKNTIPLAQKLKDTARLFILHYNTQELYLKKNEPIEAAYHINKAEYYLQFFPEKKSYHAAFEVSKGRHLFLQGKYDAAIEKLKEAIALSKEINFMDGIMDGYSFYIEALEQKEDYKLLNLVNKELNFYEEQQFTSMKDEAVNVATAQIKLREYEKELKATELQNQLSQQKADRNKIFLIAVSAVATILGIYLLTVLIYYRKRKKYVERLKKKNRQYLEAKEESEAMAKSKTKFFSTVSHELRTPLYGVIGLSTILLEDKSLKNHEDDLKSLKFSADYLLALINDVLQLNKIDSNTIVNEEVDFSLRNLVNTIVTTFSYIIDQNNNKIQIHIDDAIPLFIRGSSIMLSQILMNLVGNAVKFTENGTIDITAKIKSENNTAYMFAFYISDNGIGIPKDKHETIFDEFSQIHTKKYNDPGTGLGLPIVKKLLMAAKSDISIESSLGKGATFHFELEFLKTDQQAEEKPVLPLDKYLIQNKKILVVDDNKINQKITEKILKNHGMKPTMAANGEEAVTLVKTIDFDAILMDLNMPVLDGFEATSQIRAFDQNIPIIALTAVEVDEVYAKIVDVGMNDIIVKPYDVEKFLQCITNNISTDDCLKS